MSERTRTSQGQDIRIREASVDDRPRLIELINAAFSVETFLDGTRTDEERLTAMMAKGAVLVAEDTRGYPVGAVYIEKREDRGYLGMLAVDPERQGQGLGRRLMEEAEARFRGQGCKAVDITVLSLRPELLPIYRRFGFVETGIEEFKTSQRLQPGMECHCIAMSKQL